MKKKMRKTISTILIIVVSGMLFVALIYVNATYDKIIPEYTGIFLAIIPAILINNIWNRKFRKKKKSI